MGQAETQDHCPHGIKTSQGYERWWKPMRSRELAKKNVFAFRCARCSCVMIREIVPDETKIGASYKVITYLPKNELKQIVAQTLPIEQLHEKHGNTSIPS